MDEKLQYIVGHVIVTVLFVLLALFGAWIGGSNVDYRWHQCVTACGSEPVDDSDDEYCRCRESGWLKHPKE